MKTRAVKNRLVSQKGNKNEKKTYIKNCYKILWSISILMTNKSLFVTAIDILFIIETFYCRNRA